MNLELLTYNTSDINDNASFAARFVDFGDVNQPRSQTKLVERPNTFPAFGYKRTPARRMTIGIEPLVDTVKTIEIIKKIFDTGDPASSLLRLVARDRADANRQWYLDCTVEEAEWNGDEYEVTFLAPDPYWTTVNATSNTVTNPTSGSTWTVTTIGTKAIQPVVRFTPTAARVNNTGFKYARWVWVFNNLRSRLTNWPINLANGDADNGWNTCALVQVSKMRSDMNDMWVSVNGAKVNRWLSNTNTSVTRVWVNLNLAPCVVFTTDASLSAASTFDSIVLADTRRNDKMLDELPARGQFMIEGEVFTYRGKRVNERILKNVVRGAQNTASTAHAASISASWLQYVVQMAYGNNTLTADPNTHNADNFQPILNLDSRNHVWIYDNFSSRRGTHSAEWTYAVIGGITPRPAGDDTGIYTGDRGTVADPASEMGMGILGELDGTRYRRGESDLWWTLRHPAGFVSASFVGEKYRSSGEWPKKAQMLHSTDGKQWTQQFNEVTPTAAQTWQNIATPNAPALTGSPLWIGFRLKGGVSGGSVQESARMEFAALTASIVQANVPSASMSAEGTEHYHLRNTFANETTGETIKIDAATTFGKAIVLDTAIREIYQDKNKTNLIGGLEITGAVRDNWLTLSPSANNLVRYIDKGTGNFTVQVSWKDRAG